MNQHRSTHAEGHRGARSGWLRAAVLGADDGVVSTASLMLGVAASSASTSAVLVAGVAGLVAGALSMAAGEYVSVSSQSDAERADIDRETKELARDPHGELEELATIYRRRGLDAQLAQKVAEQLTAHDTLAAHMRDELALDEQTRARPLQAALVSALSFASMGVLPIVALLAAPASSRTFAVTAISLLGLALLGALGGHLGGASMTRASLRVTVGGGLAMAATALIGRLVGVAVGG